MLGGNKGKIDKLPKKQNDYIDKAQGFKNKPKNPSKS